MPKGKPKDKLKEDAAMDAARDNAEDNVARDNAEDNVARDNAEDATKDAFDKYAETEMPWNIIESYFKGHYLEQLVRHQLESYNMFVNYQIQKTIEMFNPVHIKSEQDYNIKLKKYQLEIFITFNNISKFLSSLLLNISKSFIVLLYSGCLHFLNHIVL